MGSSQSVEVNGDDNEEGEEKEEGDNGEIEQRELENPLMKKVLEQEPEMLCHASASPLSPQLSTLGTPRLGPSIKVWDPYNVLAPPPRPPAPMRPPPAFSRCFSSDTFDDDRETTEVFLISHGECGINLRPDLVEGRWPEAALTPNGQRQARALAVFLKSQGVRFNAVYSSTLERAKATAISVCQELNFSEEQIQSSEAVVEMSQGQWEGCLRSEIYNPEMVNLIDKVQPDFSAPSGESLRQVEFRMIQFLNGTVLRLHEKIRSGDFPFYNQNETKGFSRQNSQDSANSMHWDSLHKQRQGPSRKKSDKSRLQYMTTMGIQEVEEEISLIDSNYQGINTRSSSCSSSTIGVFTHAVPIKCILTALLGCSPVMSHKICIDDSSVTILQHSLRTGWQIKRLNDTAHLMLL